ncbi:hypothetical protein [Verminephrobacter eiseniae]|uniref:hypothetical protein n=1 Tax=Verminephrobacter eiseniae TaxID=364317 RepID=UPI0022377760|nr:hypothetical protein [Verminephrobacter eiseniae]MCW5238120.1 hypothetical protein [Verminephrobacter eiseniae]
MSHLQAACTTCAQHQARRHGPRPEKLPADPAPMQAGAKFKPRSGAAKATTEAVAAANHKPAQPIGAHRSARA